ncbi:MAG: tetratricopeptide repeat protein [Cyclobacteriaceae bacterium]|nr:tetratricopeptide repeat protein [Cyclobacteriaceae bacterium]
MYIAILFFLFFQLFVHGISEASADQETDSLQIHMEIQQAINLINIGDYDSAESLLDHSSEISFRNQYWYLYFLSQTATANLLEKQGDLNDVVKIYIELIRVLEKNQRFELLARAYAELGREYIEFELYKKAIGYFLLSNDFYEKSGNVREKIDNLAQLGNLYILTENYPHAEKYLTEAVSFMKSSFPGEDITRMLTDLVLVYEKMGDTEKMLEINLQLFEIAKGKSDLIAIAASLNNLGYNYATLGDHEKALKYFQNSYYTNNLVNQPDHKKAAGLTNIGITYENLGRDQIAIDTLRSAIKIWERENNLLRITELNTIIARIYLHLKEYDAAVIFSDAAFQAAEKSNSPEGLSKCYETYSLIFQETDDFEKALSYHKKFLQLNDSIQNLEIARERLLNQREFYAEQAEKELSLIIADRELKDLMMRQMHLENETSQKEIALLKSNQELQELEKERALQGLELTRQALEAEKKDREIEYLQQQQELQRLALARKDAEEKEQKKNHSTS